MNELVPHKKGDTWSGMVVTVKENGLPVDLTGYSAISLFKNSPNGSVYLDFNTTNGTLTIPNPIDGKIYYTGRKIEIPANVYVFDLQLTSPSGTVQTVANGSWRITQDIT